MFTQQATQKYVEYVETIDWYEFGWKCEKIALKGSKIKKVAFSWKIQIKGGVEVTKMSNCVTFLM